MLTISRIKKAVNLEPRLQSPLSSSLKRNHIIFHILKFVVTTTEVHPAVLFLWTQTWMVKEKKNVYKQVKQENRSLSHLCRTKRCSHSQWSACFYSRCYGNGCLKRSLHLCYARNGRGREGSQITITIPWYINVYIHI